MSRHPLQPLETDQQGRLRFKRNAIVDHLARGKLNDLAMMDFPQEDWEQLAQLIGYSLAGFGTLSYVSDATYNAAAESVGKELPPEVAAEKAVSYQKGWDAALMQLSETIAEMQRSAQEAAEQKGGAACA
jgi:hypothetical protein